MTAEFAFGVLVALVALGLALMAIVRLRNLPVSREEQLAMRVRDLEATVRTLQQDHVRDQERIQQMEAQLVDAQKRIVSLEAELQRYLPATRTERPLLLVGMGDDTRLGVDLAALRSATERSGMRLVRLSPVSRDNLGRMLERHRRDGRPIRNVHLAVHAGPDGLHFCDGIADGVWLSEQLADVHVLLIAGCEGDVVGDLLGVVPTVVTLRETISHRDAWQLASVFWELIGQGLTPQTAFERTLKRVPPGVAEFMELHC